MQSYRVYELTEFGKLCQRGRVRMGSMTRPELARKLGVTPMKISEIERGSVRPTDEYVCKVTGILGLSTEEVRASLQASELQYYPSNVVPLGISI